ncbi:hypothetical protein B0H21DRAFT_781715 [Amylocystis lapponica]|nr:hypothetical protein B0H21DRAFT_781715 [Amylocystis lapponica]
MSAALNTRDTSVQSIGTHPDLSLNSFGSGFSTPGRNLRIPSTSSQTTATSSAPLSTPSPPNALASFAARRKHEEAPSKRLGLSGLGLSGHEEEDEDGDADVLDTPGREKRWGKSNGETPGRPKRTRSSGKGGVNLTLRDQEKHIDSLKKENFNIKLKVHFLEERLAQLAPDQIDAALKQNINLKIEVHERGIEMKRLKKLVLQLDRELQRLQGGSAGASSRARELEEKLEEREREVRELRRRRAVGPDDGALRDVETRNAELEEELEGVRALLEENMDEMERLKELVERRGDDAAGDGGRWRQQVEELEGENEELRAKMDDLEELLTRRGDEKEDLMDELEAARLELENLQRRREANLNAVRDKLAAAQIELQQKEDEIDMKNREIEELVGEHTRIVDSLDDDWRGEVDEARGQVEELVIANREIQELGDQVYSLEEENERLKEDSERMREDDIVERERLEALAAALRKYKVSMLKSQLQEVTDLYETQNKKSTCTVQRERMPGAPRSDLDKAEQEYDAALRREHRALEAKDSALQSALSDLSQTQSLLTQREADLAAVQTALQTLEAESKKLGESHTTARFSLSLRWIASSNRELASQLAAQTQARLNLSEKLDDAQGNLRTAESDLTGIRSLDYLPYMDKILGVDKTPKKNGQAETKPYTNFSVFHDNLITRMKALSQIQLDFDKRCKDAELKYSEKLNDMRKQLDFRWRQIDKFESSLKTLAETKALWRKKMNTKEGEIEALKTTNADLQQIVTSRKPGQADSMEIRALTVRASNAERRLANLQNQLAASEEKVTVINQKTTVADNKWEVRVKEYESRLKSAEERIKRERQGGKERALELETQTKSYQRQIEIANKRIQQLNEMLDANGVPVKNHSPTR